MLRICIKKLFLIYYFTHIKEKIGELKSLLSFLINHKACRSISFYPTVFQKCSKKFSITLQYNIFVLQYNIFVVLTQL